MADYSTYFNSSDITITVNHNCSFWEVYNNVTAKCECVNKHQNFIKCNSDGSVSFFSLHGLCLTLMDNSTAVLSSCLYSYDKFLKHITRGYEYDIKTYTLETISIFCNSFNRQGLLCGECRPGYGIPVFSNSLACTDCVHYQWNWLKYIALAYLPMTCLFGIMFIFKISATSGSVLPYVIISQIISTRDLLIIITQIQMTDSGKTSLFIRIFYSMWSLDLFRSIPLQPFCLHPSASSLFIVSLDYLVALYPMIAVILLYLLLKLHDNFWLVRFLYSPVNRCLHKLRKEWNLSSSLIESFATLLILSYAKILSVSYQIMSPVFFTYKDNSISSAFVYHDPTLQYFSKHHLPYFLLALTMTVIFNLFPILFLCLYPTVCCQKCLDRTKLQSPVLVIFTDALHGSYRRKPSYLVQFTAVFMILQVLNAVLLSTFYFQDYVNMLSYVMLAMVILLMACKPFKNSHHNTAGIVLFVIVLLWYISMSYCMEMLVWEMFHWRDLVRKFTSSILLLPPLYGAGLILKCVLPRKLTKAIRNFLARAIKGRRNRCHQYMDISESLPFRLSNPQEFGSG